jgi:hypothetical protein
VRLPPGLVEGATEPRRWAVSAATARLLDRPGDLAGHPAEAAFAVALVEYLATAFQDGRWPDGGHVTRLLREGRGALRSALGLSADATPQAAFDALLAAATGHDGAAVLAAVARPDARPWTALAALDPRDGALGPLRRALRAARDMVVGAGFVP